jgi:PAS domain S-box-containing protein
MEQDTFSGTRARAESDVPVKSRPGEEREKTMTRQAKPGGGKKRQVAGAQEEIWPRHWNEASFLAGIGAPAEGSEALEQFPEHPCVPQGLSLESGAPGPCAGLCRRAEARLRGEKRRAGPLSADGEAGQMVHEIEVRGIELELQNEALTRAREEFKRQVEKYSDLYNFAPVGYFTLDRDGTVREANLGAAKLLGTERSQFVGRRLRSFLCRESRRVFDGWLKQMYEGTAGGKCEVALLTSGDLPEYVQIEGALAESEDTPGRQCRVAMIDVTGRRQAEEALKQHRDELELLVEERTAMLSEACDDLRAEVEERKRAEAERLRLEELLLQSQKMEAIGTLAGGIAHDFNNMLAIIIGNTEMAMDDVKGGQLPGRSLDHILNAAKRGRDLVREILTFSRKAQRERTPTDVISVLHETFKLLRSTLPTTINMSLDIRSESGIILGDSVQVQQILMNLATNAAHAMRKAGGRLTIRLVDAAFQPEDILPDPDMKPGRYVMLIVEDTGTGMTDDVRSRIFEPFFTTKEAGQGTGMGLSVVYGIVKNYNGALNVESGPGKGSTFTIYLPKAESRTRNEEDAAKPVRGNKEHILFIDDEGPLTEIAEAMLRKLGYRVTAMTDSREAWDLFLEDPHAFDLVVTDQTMPDLTGLALAQKMIRIRPDLPVMLCTGYSETVSPEEARKAGAREFLIKPLVRVELAAAIRRALDGAESGQ